MHKNLVLYNLPESSLNDFSHLVNLEKLDLSPLLERKLRGNMIKAYEITAGLERVSES